MPQTRAPAPPPKARACPIDRAQLVPVVVHGTYTPVTIDLCPSCRGVFMDAGEMGKLLGFSAPVPLVSSRDGDRGPLSCPTCAASMGPKRVEEVAVDLCPSCGGLWLDRGELATIQDRVRHAQASTAALAAASPWWPLADAALKR